MTELVETAVLPDGSDPAQGEDAAVLAHFNSATDTFPIGNEKLRRTLSQFHRAPRGDYDVACVVERLISRGFLVESPHPGPRLVSPPVPMIGGIALPNVRRLPDVYFPGDPKMGEKCFVATPLGRKAARLTSLPAALPAPWMLGNARLVDQILLAFFPPHELGFDDIDMACCCSCTENVRECLGSPAVRTLIEGGIEKNPKFTLTVEGEGRAVSVRAELEDLWLKMRMAKMKKGEQFDKNAGPDRKSVFLIHGRNDQGRRAMVAFLRACGLTPIEFDDLRAELGGTVSVLDVVNEGMRRAQGIVALFTPDERAVLRQELRAPGDTVESVSRWQARPNVIFEAGMAFARDPKRVVFVVLGETQLFSDVAGVLVIYLGKGAKARSTLRNTLEKSLRCDVEDSSAWLDAGDFDGCVFAANAPADDKSLAAGDSGVEHGSSVASCRSPLCYPAELVTRPQALDHQFFRLRLMLYGPNSDGSTQRGHAKNYITLRVESENLARSSFADGDERRFCDAVRDAFSDDANVELGIPDPNEIVLAKTDEGSLFYRTWGWHSSGAMGLGATLPMLCASERYSVADALDDMVRLLTMARSFIGAGAATVFVGLCSEGLAYQVEPSVHYRTSRTGMPRAYNLGTCPECYVEKVFDTGALATANLAAVSAEMLRLALVRSHRERVDLGILQKLAANAQKLQM